MNTEALAKLSTAALRNKYSSAFDDQRSQTLPEPSRIEAQKRMDVIAAVLADRGEPVWKD